MMLSGTRVDYVPLYDIMRYYMLDVLLPYPETPIHWGQVPLPQTNRGDLFRFWISSEGILRYFEGVLCLVLLKSVWTVLLRKAATRSRRPLTPLEESDYAHEQFGKVLLCLKQ